MVMVIKLQTDIYMQIKTLLIYFTLISLSEISFANDINKIDEITKVEKEQYSMSSKPIKPETVLSDAEDKVLLNGITGRKGSVAAFLQNIDIIEQPNITSQERSDVIKVMEELAPVLVAVGLHKHAVFKNPEVQKMLDNAAKLVE